MPIRYTPSLGALSLAWSVWLLMLLGIGALMIVSAFDQGMAAHADWAIGVAAVSLLVILANVAMSILLLTPKPVAYWAAASVWLPCIAASFSLCAIRVVLPWEEPETGYGSPLATLINVVMYAGIGVVSSTPGVGLLIWGAIRRV